MNWNEVQAEMKVAFDFLLSHKKWVKSIINHEDDFDKVMDIIVAVFDDEYVELYPDNYSIFNCINTDEFFTWCKENIEGFTGGEYEPSPRYWCKIKDQKM